MHPKLFDFGVLSSPIRFLSANFFLTRITRVKESYCVSRISITDSLGVINQRNLGLQLDKSLHLQKTDIGRKSIRVPWNRLPKGLMRVPATRHKTTDFLLK
jgi:hypothetical protein